jgi:hypothetical protein
MEKLGKMMPGAMIFEVPNPDNVYENLNKLFKKLDKAMEPISNTLLDKGILDTPLDWLLKEDHIWKTLSYEKKIQRIELMTQKTEASNLIVLEPPRPHSPTDLISFFDPVDELDELLGNFVSFVDFDPKKILRSSERFANSLQDVAMKIKVDPNLEAIQREITHILSDQVTAIFMGSRIFGTINNEDVLEVLVCKKQDFFNEYLKLTSDYVVDHIDILLAKSRDFILKQDKKNDRKVTGCLSFYTII